MVTCFSHLINEVSYSKQIARQHPWSTCKSFPANTTCFRSATSLHWHKYVARFVSNSWVSCYLYDFGFTT